MSSKGGKSPDLITSSSTDFRVIRDRIHQFIIIAGVVAALLLFGFRVMVALHFTDRSQVPETRIQPIDPRVEERQRAEALRLQEEAAERLANEAERQHTEKDLELFLQEWVFYRAGRDYYLPTVINLNTETGVLKIDYSYLTDDERRVVITQTCRQKEEFHQFWDCRWVAVTRGTIPTRGEATLTRENESLFSGILMDPYTGVVVFYIAKDQTDIPTQSSEIVP